LLVVENVTAEVADPLHNTWFVTVLTWPLGLTVTVKVTGSPLQVTPPLVYDGVTVIVLVIAAPELFVAVKLILPVPEAEIPVAVLSFVHENTVPVTVPVNEIVFDEPLQIIWFCTAFTVGGQDKVVTLPFNGVDTL